MKIVDGPINLNRTEVEGLDIVARHSMESATGNTTERPGGELRNWDVQVTLCTGLWDPMRGAPALSAAALFGRPWP